MIKEESINNKEENKKESDSKSKESGKKEGEIKPGEGDKNMADVKKEFTQDEDRDTQAKWFFGKPYAEITDNQKRLINQYLNGEIKSAGDMYPKEGKEKKADEGYQGHFNHSTWACALWIDNSGVGEDIRFSIKEGDLKNQQEVEDYIKNYVEENMPEIPNSMYLDILNANLAEINYKEIAEDIWKESDKPEVSKE